MVELNLKKEYLVEKRNVLNEIRANSMSLQELRFFSIYLAKINSRDITTRVVRFTLEEFQKIMELGRLNLEHLSHTIDNLLCKVVGVPREDGGVDRFQLFKKGTIAPDENGWFVEIDAHDEALPLMFEFKERYFTYELWNALRLKSVNQFRMYEILKQEEWRGEKIISVKELRNMLGINEKEYTRFGDFRCDVLEVCRKALQENTDIKYTYEPYGKKGKGGKILQLKFIISMNNDHKDQISLDEFIDLQNVTDINDTDIKEIDEINGIIENKSENDDESDYFLREYYPFLTEACDNEFSPTELQVLYNIIVNIIPYQPGKTMQLNIYKYLKRKYDELKWRDSMTKIKNRMGYIKKIIEADLKI